MTIIYAFGIYYDNSIYSIYKSCRASRVASRESRTTMMTRHKLKNKIKIVTLLFYHIKNSVVCSVCSSSSILS